MHFNYPSRKISIAILIALASTSAYSVELEREKLDLVIGGAELRPLSSPAGQLNFGLSNSLDDFFKCGDVDIEDVLKASFSDAKGQVNRLQSQIIETIAGSTNLTSAAGTILRRTYPDEYDAIINGIANVKADWGTTLTQCGKAQELMWDTVVGGEGKKEAQGYGWVNFNANAKAGKAIWTEDFTKTIGTNSGIPVGKEEKGGSGQLPVTIPSDIIKTSYDLFNANSNDPDSIGLKFYFANQTAAIDFVEELVGKTELRFCDDCESDFSAGKGIRPSLIKEKERVKDELKKVVTKDAQYLITLSPEDYYKISYSSKVPINSTILNSLKALPGNRQERYMDSLSEEIAVANIMEKTIVARRLIQTGMREKTLKNSETIRSASQELLDALDFEIDNIEREMRTSGLLKNATTRALLQHEQINRNSGLL